MEVKYRVFIPGHGVMQVEDLLLERKGRPLMGFAKAMDGKGSPLHFVVQGAVKLMQYSNKADSNGYEIYEGYQVSCLANQGKVEGIVVYEPALGWGVRGVANMWMGRLDAKDPIYVIGCAYELSEPA